MIMSVVVLLALSFVSARPGGQVQPEPPMPPGQPLPSPQEPPRELVLVAGKSTVVTSQLPIERISVGFGDIAEATAISPVELLLNAKTPGVTSLIVWQKGGATRFYDVKVMASSFLMESRLNAIKGEMERELPGQDVELSFENGSVFLRGTVRDVVSSDRAVSIASTLGKPVNLLYVDVPPPEAQILLRVKFASVDRNKSLQLGLNLFSTGATNTLGTVTTQQFSAPFVSSTPGAPVTATISNALNLFLFRPDLNLGATIEALQVKGLLQILSEPNVLAENGKPASFLAGGEFPFPSVSAGSGGAPIVSIQFREYGIRLTFTPVITPRGTIHLEVAPEVSALDFTNGLQISGFNVPALTTRKINTQVELNEGQSFAIGGLLDNRTTDTFEKVPFIGDIPILGKFFQSKFTSKTNTELIVIVTPEFVRPIPAGQPAPELKYSTPFMEPNTGKELRTPGMSVTGPEPVTPPNPAIPIERLIKSMQPVVAPVQQTTPAIGTPANAPAQTPQ
jgi:pilus assembly protein CpaC